MRHKSLLTAPHFISTLAVCEWLYILKWSCTNKNINHSFLLISLYFSASPSLLLSISYFISLSPFFSPSLSHSIYLFSLPFFVPLSSSFLLSVSIFSLPSSLSLCFCISPRPAHSSPSLPSTSPLISLPLSLPLSPPLSLYLSFSPFLTLHLSLTLPISLALAPSPNRFHLTPSLSPSFGIALALSPFFLYIFLPNSSEEESTLHNANRLCNYPYPHLLPSFSSDNATLCTAFPKQR